MAGYGWPGNIAVAGYGRPGDIAVADYGWQGGDIAAAGRGERMRRLALRALRFRGNGL